MISSDNVISYFVAGVSNLLIGSDNPEPSCRKQSANNEALIGCTIVFRRELCFCT